MLRKGTQDPYKHKGAAKAIESPSSEVSVAFALVSTARREPSPEHPRQSPDGTEHPFPVLVPLHHGTHLPFPISSFRRDGTDHPFPLSMTRTPGTERPFLLSTPAD